MPEPDPTSEVWDELLPVSVQENRETLAERYNRILSFLGPAYVEEALDQEDYDLAEEVHHLTEIIRAQHLKAADRLAAMKHLRELVLDSLRISGNLTRFTATVSNGEGGTLSVEGEAPTGAALSEVALEAAQQGRSFDSKQMKRILSCTRNGADDDSGDSGDPSGGAPVVSVEPEPDAPTEGREGGSSVGGSSDASGGGPVGEEGDSQTSGPDGPQSPDEERTEPAGE
jgi:hypothetical protein